LDKITALVQFTGQLESLFAGGTGTTSTGSTAASIPTAPGDHSPGTGRIEYRHFTQGPVALAVFARDSCVGVFHGTQGFKIFAAVNADIFIYWHNHLFTGYFIAAGHEGQAETHTGLASQVLLPSLGAHPLNPAPGWGI
jgi:hypothetical protein